MTNVLKYLTRQWQKGTPTGWFCGHLVLKNVHFTSSCLANANRISVSEDRKSLHLSLKDNGSPTSFNSKWLRHNCHCPNCLFQPTNQPTVPLAILREDLKILSAEIKDDYLHYKIKSETSGDAHTGYCLLKNLKKFSVTRSAKRQLSEPLMVSSLPVSDYNSITMSDLGLHRWLKDLNYYGLSLVKNIPTNKGEIKKLAHKIGKIQSTIYGETFDVITSVTPTNRAYTDQELIPHMDLTFYEDMPGLQFLHCIKNDKAVKGGESVLLDCYAVALEMKREYPKHFEILTKVPVVFERIHHNHEDGNPVSFIYENTVISLNGESDIISIRWSPQLLGSCMMNQQDIEPFYEAFTLFDSMIKESKHKIYHRLVPGEAITFNNRRILHGRNKIFQNEGVRHFEGVYVSSDVFRNRFIVLSEKLGIEAPPKHVLNGSWSA